ncbi:MAG: hypothetical protein C0171_04415 [Caldisphaera sp.]|nr:MAG: hypothetical protein C0171_04415 [Caldisphaera sp.]
MEDYSKLRAYTLVSTSISIFLYGFSVTLGSLLTQISFYPKSMELYLLIEPPVSLLLGNFLFSYVADKYGRKPVLVITPILFSIGILLFLLLNPYISLIGIGLFLFSIAGGDEPAIISYLTENLSANDRGRFIMLITNFVNIGALLSSIIFIFLENYTIIKLTITFILILSLTSSYFFRKKLPESKVWVLSNSKNISFINENHKRILPLILISISTILTYGLISWVIGPYYYPNLTYYIVLLFNLGNIAGGLLGYFIISKIKRTSFTLFGFFGGSLTSLILLLIVHSFNNYILFLSLILTNGIFTQLTWGTRLVLEGELLRTKYRATGISVVRASGWIIYIFSAIFTYSFSIAFFQIYDILFWIIGLLGSALWYTYGFDTNNLQIIKLDEINL